MDEELQKRNTDCVYFLASPLTCKKGMECEYRHSEIARLNPRDCWYWLAGSCLSSTCAFRHPPLDGRKEASSDSAPPLSECAVPVNKTNFPCYFYFNTFCNKGDKCSFLHGPEDSTRAWKSLRTTSAVTDAAPLEKKISTGSDTGSTPMESHPNASETAPKGAVETQINAKQDFHQLGPNNVAEKNASPHISASECEKAAAVGSDCSLPAEGFIQSRSLLCTDQSSEEQGDGHIEREEWLESSPGFDVLVDGISENLGYDDDPDYLLALAREGGEINGQFAGYDYKDPVEYDPAYPDLGISYELKTNDSYGHLDNEHTCDRIRNIPGYSRKRISDCISPRKRKFQRGMDLRDHLKKRRAIDGCAATHFSRRHDLPRLIGRSRERPRWQDSRRMHGRLMSEVVSRSENETLLNGVNQRVRLRPSLINRSRQHLKEKWHSKQPILPSEVTRKSASKKRSTEEYSIFTGPKTLDQIKEEKKKAHENGDSFGETKHLSRTASEDFQGPKPLSEILMVKKRLGSVIDRNNDSS